MIVNSEKHLFQWDIQQKMITHGVEYIDYIIDTEVVRVRCEDGKCIIPDECLQHSGVFTCWACSDIGTYTEYTFPVKARLMPPDYVFTPTQRETFDQLVERVDLAAYEAMRQADLARQAADTANTAAANADTVAAIIRQMAIEGEFDGFSPEVKLEPVEGGTLLTITDRSGDHTAFIKDGQGSDITKEAIIEALQYTPADQANTYTKAEVDEKNAEVLASANTFTEGQVDSIRQELSEKMEFYPVMLEGSPMQFRHYEPDGTFTVLGFTELADKYNDPRWFLYCEYASITFIPSLPPVEDPVHPDKVLEFSAAWYYDGSHWLTSIKINESNAIKIEEHQIPTRTEMQTALAEKVGFTDYATSGTYGVLRGGSDGFALYNGSAYAATYSQEQYNSKGNTTFISKGTIENIKSDLTKRALTVEQDAWTEAEQLAARQRIGIDKKFYLIEEITLTEDTVEIYRNAEPNGTPYNFTAVSVKVTVPTLEASGVLDICAKPSSAWDKAYRRFAYGTVAVSPTVKTISGLIMDVGGKQFSIGHQPSDNLSFATVQIAGGNICTMKWENVTDVSFRMSGNNSKGMPVGTKIEIYGIRA